MRLSARRGDYTSQGAPRPSRPLVPVAAPRGYGDALGVRGPGCRFARGPLAFPQPGAGPSRGLRAPLAQPPSVGLGPGEHLSLGNFLMANRPVLCLFQLQASGYRIKSNCNYRLVNTSRRCSTAEGNGVWCIEVQSAHVNYSVIMGLCVYY